MWPRAESGGGMGNIIQGEEEKQLGKLCQDKITEGTWGKPAYWVSLSLSLLPYKMQDLRDRSTSFLEAHRDLKYAALSECM